MQTRIWIGWAALTAAGILGACSDGGAAGGDDTGGSAGSTAAGSAGKPSGGANSSGAGGSSTAAGNGGTTGNGGSTAGSGGSTAGSSGASGGDAGSGGAQGGVGAGGEDAGQGGQDVGQGGSGSGDTNCKIEALDFKVSGGVSFERTWPSMDQCGGVTGGENDPLVVTFFLNPPQLENTVNASSIAYSIPPGTTGTFTPESVSVVSTGAIWSTSFPDPQQPLACSMNVTKYEKVDDVRWRVAGSVSCPAALGGFGANAGTPLTIEDWSYTIVIDMTME